MSNVSQNNGSKIREKRRVSRVSEIFAQDLIIYYINRILINLMPGDVLVMRRCSI